MRKTAESHNPIAIMRPSGNGNSQTQRLPMRVKGKAKAKASNAQAKSKSRGSTCVAADRTAGESINTTVATTAATNDTC